jgi:L-serine dehydratase
MYKESIDRMNAMGIGVDVIKGQDYGIQKITIETEQSTVMVDTLNRGGGRIVLRDALPSREEAMEIAKKLGIVVVEK